MEKVSMYTISYNFVLSFLEYISLKKYNCKYILIIIDILMLKCQYARHCDLIKTAESAADKC